MAKPRRTADIRRSVLPNGLRLVVVPEPGTAVVAIAVHYAVGYRGEPPGRAGFAHLFEHLMFQGSEHVAKLAHFRYVQASGGSCNAVTARDHTCYHQITPANALDRALFLEADRMRAPRFTASSLANQVTVIREEIGAKVLGRPYGGLPWLLMPPILFDNFANTHNGYGAVAELATATIADCEAFFDSYYAPANAVLTVTGDVNPIEVRQLVEHHFGPVPARAAPPPPEIAEPPLDADREHTHHDPLAPLAGTVIGWRLPAPADSTRLAFAVLAAILADGEHARLRHRLVRSGATTHVSAVAGLGGELLDSRDPDVFVVTAMHRPGPGGATAATVLTAVDDELTRLAAGGPAPEELAQAGTRVAARGYRRYGRLRDRAQMLGAYEILHGRAELAWQIADLARDVTGEAVALAAAELAGAHRAVLHIRPGSAAR
jgi:zinc protease